MNLRGSSMGVCEALCDMFACKKGITNTFLFDLRRGPSAEGFIVSTGQEQAEIWHTD